MKKLFYLVLAVVLLGACSAKNTAELGGGEYGKSDPTAASDYAESGGDGGIVAPGEGGEGSEGGEVVPGNEQGEAGRVTAGEWNDLNNWLLWSNLMTNQQADQEGSDFTMYSSYWGFYTNHLVAVRVSDSEGKPVLDAPVELVASESGTVLYRARTDNKGETALWIGLTQEQSSVDEAGLALVVNGTKQAQAVTVTDWGEELTWNELTAAGTSGGKRIDIAFIVDATGSMSDEISFLQADLTNIISTVQSKHNDADIRTAALFYRDEGDEYVTRVNDFTDKLSQTTDFIKKQCADGGGDYPEAVHTALVSGLQELSWREDQTIRLAFMLLDAPPHKQDDVIKKLQDFVPQYAKSGIRIIPVAASGVDKPTEFFLRFIALATDGTYVFITNHSGIGNDHIAATVGDYKVELLNELMVRLVDQYLQ